MHKNKRRKGYLWPVLPSFYTIWGGLEGAGFFYHSFLLYAKIGIKVVSSDDLRIYFYINLDIDAFLKVIKVLETIAPERNPASDSLLRVVKCQSTNEEKQL
jgi:hypothetical protein